MNEDTTPDFIKYAESIHEHDWIPVGNDGYRVMFGCTCGEAIYTTATTHVAEDIKNAIRAVVYEARSATRPLTEAEQLTEHASVTEKQQTLNGYPAMLVSVRMIDKLRGLLEDKR